MSLKLCTWLHLSIPGRACALGTPGRGLGITGIGSVLVDDQGYLPVTWLSVLGGFKEKVHGQRETGSSEVTKESSSNVDSGFCDVCTGTATDELFVSETTW